MSRASGFPLLVFGIASLGFEAYHVSGPLGEALDLKLDPQPLDSKPPVLQ